MALSDVVADLRGTGLAPTNRVKILLKRLEGSEDRDLLVHMLRDRDGYSSAFITKAIHTEYDAVYGHDVVKSGCVAAYRREYLPREVSGL